MPFPPTFDHAWDITQPPDTQLANLLGQDIRNLKDDVMQRMSLLSGTLANRPTPETVNATWGGAGFGLIFLATDTQQLFQWSGAAWVQISFAGNIVATLNLTGQNAAIPTTTLFAVTVTGMYRVSVDFLLTAAGTGGTIQYIIGWNNGIAAQVSGGPSIGAAGIVGSEFNASAGVNQDFSSGFFVPAGQNITYNVTFTGVTGSPQYSFRSRVEFLG